MTIDFSCVRSNAGLLSLTSTPAFSNACRVAAFSVSPLRRAGFSITRTCTPRLRAVITAASNAGSENRNILIRSDLRAAAIAARNGSAVSSGRTTKVWDMMSRKSGSGLRRRGVVLDPMQLGKDSAALEELVVATFLGDDAILQHDDFVRITN